MKTKRHTCSLWTTFDREEISGYEIGRIYMICKIYGEETNNSDGTCDECKFSVIDLDDISSNM